MADPAVNEICSYRSISGEVYDAHISAVRANKTVDVEIWLPDGRVALERKGLLYIPGAPPSLRGVAFTKRSKPCDS